MARIESAFRITWKTGSRRRRSHAFNRTLTLHDVRRLHVNRLLVNFRRHDFEFGAVSAILKVEFAINSISMCRRRVSVCAPRNDLLPLHLNSLHLACRRRLRRAVVHVAIHLALGQTTKTPRRLVRRKIFNLYFSIERRVCTRQNSVKRKMGKAAVAVPVPLNDHKMRFRIKLNSMSTESHWVTHTLRGVETESRAREPYENSHGCRESKAVRCCGGAQRIAVCVSIFLNQFYFSRFFFFVVDVLSFVPFLSLTDSD